jgi:HlyD family secretion protein
MSTTITSPTATTVSGISEAQLAERRRHKAQKRALLRWLKRGLLALLALAGAAAVARAWMPKTVLVDTATARRAPLETFVTEEGRTRVRDRFVVLAPANGVLLRVNLEAGAPVAVGAPLALIRPPEPALLDARSRADLEARLNGARAREQQARSALRRTREAHELSAREAERSRGLGNAIPDAERERALAEERISAADLAAAEQGVAIAAAETRSIAASLGQAAGGKLEDLVVTAPSAGRVLRVLRESEGPIVAGTPLVEIGDLHALEVVIDVLSSDSVRIAPGAPAVVEEWGGEPLTGHVVAVEPSAVTRISALGVEEQRVNVIIALDDPPARLGDGFRVEARVSTWRSEDALTVPASAVFRDGEAWAVYTMVGGRAQLQHVSLGHRGRADVEVASGVVAGATVVLYPGERVRAGAKLARRGL